MRNLKMSGGRDVISAASTVTRPAAIMAVIAASLVNLELRPPQRPQSLVRRRRQSLA
jgi:hypothetical protein